MTVLSGCTSTDYKSAVLYKQKDNGDFSRPTDFRSSQIFNGNVIQVKRGRLAHFQLEEIKVGWLKENRQLGRFPDQRLLPDKTLWLVVQIEGFKADDFLRTSSKRSFIASAVKQNQNSNGYVPLDASETTFALQTSEFQYEVSFSVYSVDDFKLKQVLGFVVKDNPGLMKIGWDAAKQLGGATLGYVADPFLNLAKHEFGQDFIFERLLLTAGAVLEFEGMVYVVGTTDPTPNSPESEKLGNFVLADLSEVMPGSKSFSDYARPAGASSPRMTLDATKTEFQNAYGATLTAINSDVSAGSLKAHAANVVRFQLTASPDKNKQTAGKTERLVAMETKIGREQNALNGQVAAVRASLVEPLVSSLNARKETAETVAKKIAEFPTPTRLSAAAEYLRTSARLDSMTSTERDAFLARISAAFELESATKDDLEGHASEALRRAGLDYLSTGLALNLLSSPAKAVVSTQEAISLSPSEVRQRLETMSSSLTNAIQRLERYSKQLGDVTYLTDKEQFAAELAKLTPKNLKDELQQLVSPIPEDLRAQVVAVINNTPEAPASDHLASLLRQYGQLHASIQERAKIQDQEGDAVYGHDITIF